MLSAERAVGIYNGYMDGDLFDRQDALETIFGMTNFDAMEEVIDMHDTDIEIKGKDYDQILPIDLVFQRSQAH
jgi:hypothetical protein